jgi:uncharacterized damage-inducible protein DinB
MTEHPLTLASFYKGWDGYQGQIIHALAPLSTEQLTLHAAPHLRSVGIIATHIIGARARWLYYALKEGNENLILLSTWDRPDQPARSAAELVSGLETTWQVIQDALQRWTGADLEEILHDDDASEEEPQNFSRQWIIWHLIEHDLHHGGEMSFALGMHNLVAIDL